MRKDAGPPKPGAPTKPVPTMTSAEISAAAVAAAVAASAAARAKGAVGSGDKPRLYTGYTWAVPATDGTDSSAATAAAPERVLVASGAVLAPPKLVQTVLGQLLELHSNLGRDDAMEVGPSTKGKVRRLADDPGKRLAIHVSPAVAVVLSSTVEAEVARVPGKLKALLASGDLLWRPGLRVLSPEVVAKKFDKQDKFRAELAQRGHDRLSAERGAATATAAASNPRFKFAELFAGIGGFRLGLEAHGGACTFASELSHDARCTYALNFGDTPSGDILEIEASAVPSFDLLTAGFPCQSFSKAGFQRGFADFRGNLFYEVTRMLHYHSPRAFLLENVPNLAELDDGANLSHILAELAVAGRGYDVQCKIITAYPWVPQDRKRLYFVGFLKETGAMPRFQWPEPPAADTAVTVQSILEPIEAVSPEHTLSNCKWEKQMTSARCAGILTRKLCRLDGMARTLVSNYRKCFYTEFVPFQNPDGTFLDHQAVYDARTTGTASSTAAGTSSDVPPAEGAAIDEASASIDGESDSCIDDDDDDEAADATKGGDGGAGANLQKGQNPRFYTPRECARIMGFPDSFVVDDVCKAENRVYHQLGNAVCPLVIKALGKSIVDTGVFEN